MKNIKNLINQRITLASGLGKITVSIAFLSASLYARPCIEKTDRLEWNWGTMTLRFWGEAQAPPRDLPWSETREKAFQQGLLSAKGAVEEYHLQHLLDLGVEKPRAERSSRLAGERTATATWARESRYFQGGLVQVHMESSLARALRMDGIEFSVEPHQQTLSESQATGLILRSSKPASPSAFYRLTDEEGKALYSLSDVDKEAYEKNLMGRWFIQPESFELERVVGSRPVTLEVTPVSKGHFMVRRDDWQRHMPGNRQILQWVKVAVVISGLPGRR